MEEDTHPLYNPVISGPEDCQPEVQELHGFLQLACKNFNHWFKCLNSDIYYKIQLNIIGRKIYSRVSAVCEDDPSFYQACGISGTESVYGRDWQINSEGPVCGYICSSGTSNAYVPSAGKSIFTIPHVVHCDGIQDCLNANFDEKHCSSPESQMVNTMTTVSNHSFEEMEQLLSNGCDGVCETDLCLDEARCNGFTYGIFCTINLNNNDIMTDYYTPAYVFVHDVCAFWDDNYSCKINREVCQIPADEQSCRVIGRPEGEPIPLFNYTRCGARRRYSYNILNIDTVEICANGFEQTNCTDPARVALRCEIGGFKSTVSVWVVCQDGYQAFPPLCDDLIERECVDVTATCTVHKHQLCDGQVDCPNGGDETDNICSVLTEIKCKRRFGPLPDIPFPLTWVNDGFADCEGGEDESAEWPTCGEGRTHRFVSTDSVCSEVFLCPDSFIEFSGLCDKVETCGNENKVCISSRSMTRSQSVAISEPSPTLTTVTTSLCLPGIESIINLKDISLKCRKTSFDIPIYDFFGKNRTTEIYVPDELIDCQYFDGQLYVYLSCTDKCLDSACPLVKPIKHDSCLGGFADRIYTLANGTYLTFVTKSSGTFVNDFFVCNNNYCITFDKVCNRVDDCKDGSDEENCTNHFQCNATREYLHTSQECDGTIDCQDFSDECNDNCGKNIIDGISLKVLSFIIGILALVMNFYGLGKGIPKLVKCTSVIAFENNSLVCLIGLGDLLMGVYLFSISTLDIWYWNGYCKIQTQWMVSNLCSSMGVMSFTGTHISLFAMTMLSVMRCIGIRKALHHHKKTVGGRTLLKMGIITFIIAVASVVISVLPLLDTFEDFFVNGLVYESNNSLFIGFNDNKIHFDILQGYYGRMKRQTLKWSLVNNLVDGMFSKDYGGITRRTLHFYGNDAVCLFKYFVGPDDPQRVYVWLVLAVNFICFLVITGCYALVNYYSTKSTASAQTSIVDKVIQQRTRRLHRKISIIIATDFLCWIPFVVVCILHTTEVLDATAWYSLFSIVILPINAVINPILYNDAVSSVLDSCSEACWKWVVTVSVARAQDIAAATHPQIGDNNL